jgi:hypothetical protein
MNIVSMVKHRDKAPTNALIAESVRACAKRGIRYLIYQNFTYGTKQPDSLTKFKEVNGFKRVDVPRYYIPLTKIGRIALALCLHHSLSERIPESIASRLRDLRKIWYESRSKSASPAS